MPSVLTSAGADSFVDASPSTAGALTISSVTVVVVVVVVRIGSEADGLFSLVEPFSVVSFIAVVVSITLVTCVTVVPLTASELALRLFDNCLKFA